MKIVDPAFVKDYDSYKAGQLRADVMRFYIMYYFGGEFLVHEFILGNTSHQMLPGNQQLTLYEGTKTSTQRSHNKNK